MRPKPNRVKYTTYLTNENRAYLVTETARRNAAGERNLTQADVLNEAVDKAREAKSPAN
jgi:hypothetical protein